jgi:hypothetical protein
MGMMPITFAAPRAVSSLRLMLTRRPYTLLAAGFLICLAVVFCRRADSEWDNVFVGAARQLWAGQGLYGHGDGFLYPPFAGVIGLPFVPLPPLPGRLAWFLLNAVGLTALVGGAWHLTGGRRLEGNGVRPQEHLIFWLGLGCGLPYLFNCLGHQQVDVCLGALLVCGCIALTRSRSVLAVFAFGAAAAVKLTPLLFLPYLIWRGRWRAAVCLGVVVVALNLLPNLLCPSGTSWYLEQYVLDYLKPLTNPSYAPGMWGSAALYNQSLAGAGNRWFIDESSGAEVFANVRLGLKFASALLLLVTVFCFRRPFRPASNQPGSPPNQVVLECSAVLCLMLLLSPMSSPAHFGILLLPGLALARRAIEVKSIGLASLPVIAVILGIFQNRDLVGVYLCDLSLSLGLPTWSTLALFAGCLHCVRIGRAVEPSRVAYLASRAA